MSSGPETRVQDVAQRVAENVRGKHDDENRGGWDDRDMRCKQQEVAPLRGHHPELGWVYRRVTLRLCTHDAGDAITELDRDLMAAIAVMQSALR
jgi:hypothetical protein